MSELILVRHSLPEIDPQTPAARWVLSEEGRQRCDVLAARLSDCRAATLASSLEPKALETAARLSVQLDLPVRPWPGFHEHERSQVPHFSREVFLETMRNFFRQPRSLVFGDESAEAARSRFSEAVEDLLRRAPGLPCICVSHGTVITLFISRFNPIDAFEFWKLLELPALVRLSASDFRLIEVVRLFD